MERPRGADDRAVFAAGFESQSGGLSRPTSIVSCPTVRSNAAILASYSEIVIAAASSAFSSPRSYWLSHNCIRLAEIGEVRLASRRPILPSRISAHSGNLNCGLCRRYRLLVDIVLCLLNRLRGYAPPPMGRNTGGVV